MEKNVPHFIEENSILLIKFTSGDVFQLDLNDFLAFNLSLVIPEKWGWKSRLCSCTKLKQATCLSLTVPVNTYHNLKTFDISVIDLSDPLWTKFKFKVQITYCTFKGIVKKVKMIVKTQISGVSSAKPNLILQMYFGTHKPMCLLSVYTSSWLSVFKDSLPPSGQNSPTAALNKWANDQSQW